LAKFAYPFIFKIGHLLLLGLNVSLPTPNQALTKSLQDLKERLFKIAAILILVLALDVVF
jgi:hypothetical protein